MKTALETGLGRILHGDSLDCLRQQAGGSVSLIVTSPPYDLSSQKSYGNRQRYAYLNWLREHAVEWRRVLKIDGSLVLELGSTWTKGQPTRNLYQFRTLLMLCDEAGLHLAQDFYRLNPAAIPTSPHVCVTRMRVRPGVSTIWWLSKTTHPKADNRQVLNEYSESMKQVLQNPPQISTRKNASGHNNGYHNPRDNGGSIPSNLLVVPTGGNAEYWRRCREAGVALHPATYPAELPEFFIRFLTEPGDLVVDPFGGSCTTGEVAERLKRRWICIEQQEKYLAGAMLRFNPPMPAPDYASRKPYSLPHPGSLWASDQVVE